MRFCSIVALTLVTIPACALAQSTPTVPAPVVQSQPTTTGASPTITPSPLNTTDTQLPAAIELPALPGPLPADLPAAPLTADEAARVALRHQPTIVAATGGVTSASGRTQQARSGLLPTVGVSAGYSNAVDIGGGGTTVSGVTSSATGGSMNGVISLRQLLYDFGHTSALSNAASALERASVNSLTRTQADTVLTVKQNYYGYTQALRLVTVNEDNYRAQALHLAEARARQNAGIGIPSDVVRAQTALSEAALQLNIARNNAAVGRVTLAQAMGLDARTPVQVGETDEPVLGDVSVNDLVTLALRQRPEVLAATETARAADDALKAAKSSNSPAIIGTVGVGAKDTSFPPTSSSVGIGVALSFNPFDSGLTSGRVKEAEGNVTTARANLATSQQAVTSDVAQAYLNERLAGQRVSAAQDEVANAQEGVRLAEGRFRAGIGIFLEVTDAQQLLLAARTNLVNARSALNQARAALAHSTGSGLPQ
ncbi:MAG TPA: TolC family protein [Capsulimonadaceae bacterium]